MTLTRCVSSAGMLKLHELDVDLEILLLSFFKVILQEKQHQQTASSTVYLTNKDGDMAHTHTDTHAPLPLSRLWRVWIGRQLRHHLQHLVAAVEAPLLTEKAEQEQEVSVWCR